MKSDVNYLFAFAEAKYVRVVVTIVSQLNQLDVSPGPRVREAVRRPRKEWLIRTSSLDSLEAPSVRLQEVDLQRAS